MELQTENLENETIEPGVIFSRAGFSAGIRKSIVIALGVFSYGLVFGVLAQQAGLSILETALMCSLVFAGSSQFAALGIWAYPVPILPIILTTGIVNLRHIIMSASLYRWFKDVPALPRYLTLFFLNDESYALTVTELEKGKKDAAFLLGSGCLLFLAWLSSGLVGRSLGSFIQDPAQFGLDFVFTAVFVALAVGMWRGKRTVVPWLVAGAVAGLAAWLLPGKWYILLGGIAGSLAGAWQDGD